MGFVGGGGGDRGLRNGPLKQALFSNNLKRENMCGETVDSTKYKKATISKGIKL